MRDRCNFTSNEKEIQMTITFNISSNSQDSRTKEIHGETSIALANLVVCNLKVTKTIKDVGSTMIGLCSALLSNLNIHRLHPTRAYLLNLKVTSILGFQARMSVVR